MSLLLFKGGITKIEWATDSAFTTPHEIPGIMKSTKVEISTPVDEDAAGKSGSAGKSVKADIISKDLTAAVYTDLIAAEEAHTELYFRITGINTAQKLVLKKCPPIVEFAPAEVGKLANRKVSITGFADTEANLMALTLS